MIGIKRLASQETQINIPILNWDMFQYTMEIKKNKMVKQTEMKRVVELKVPYSQLCANLPTSFMEW